MILDTSMDGVGGKPKLKESCKKIEHLCSSFNLIDIWRIRYPETEEPNNTTSFRFLVSY